MIHLQAALAFPTYFYDDLYQPYPLRDYGRVNVGSGNYQLQIYDFQNSQYFDIETPGAELKCICKAMAMTEQG